MSLIGAQGFAVAFTHRFVDVSRPSRSVRSSTWLERRCHAVKPVKSIMAIVFASCALLLMQSVSAQTTPATIDCTTNASVFNTAYDLVTGGALPVTTPNTADAHWESSADGVNWTSSLVSGRLASVWAVSPFGNADWISPSFTPPNYSPVYYRYRFNLDPSVPLANFTIQYDFYVDDNLQTVSVNGTQVLNFVTAATPNGAGGYTSAGLTHMVIAGSQWQTGANEILLKTYNVTPPSGFMAQTTVSSTCPTVTKTAVPAPTAGPLNAGSPVTYTVTVSNPSATDASGTIVSDPLPAGIASGATWTCSADSTPAVCPNASGTLPLQETIATFPPQSHLIYTIAATVASGNLPTSIKNTAVVTPPGNQSCTDGTTPPCQASVTHTLTALTLTKTVTSSDSKVSGVTNAFNFTVTCGAFVFSPQITLTLSLSGSVSVPGVVPGNCTIAETAPAAPPANYAWDTLPANQTIAMTAAGTNHATVTNNLVRQVIVVPLAKAVTLVNPGSTATPTISGTITIQADCSASGDGTASGSIALSGLAGSGSINLPAGATCTLTEAVASLPAVANYTWSTAPTPASVTLTNVGAASAAAFTNVLTRQTQLVTIHKTVTTSYAGTEPFSLGFVANCSSSSDGQYTQSITFNYPVGGSAPAMTVPAGAACAISETSLPAPPANYAWGPTPVPVSVGSNNGYVAAFTNALSRQSSDIQINKSVSGAPSGGIDATFDFTVTCTGVAGSPFSAAITLVGGTSGTTSVTGVPAGSSCSVAEVAPAAASAPAGYAWDQTPPVVSLTTTQTGPNAAAFTNHLIQQFGSLEVVTSVAGTPAAYSASFAITVACTLNGVAVTPAEGSTQSSNSSVTTPGTVTFTQIPQGAVCTVSETQPAAPTGYSWNSPVYTPLGAIGATVVTATVVNTAVAAPLSAPIFTKSSSAIDAQTEQWNLSATNSNVLPEVITINDPVPAGVTYVPGSVACTAPATTTIASCALNGTLLTVQATLGAGDTLTATVQTALIAGTTSVTNVASVNWDQNNSGSDADEITADQQPVSASSSYVVTLPPPPPPPPGKAEPVPAMSNLILALLAALFGCGGALRLLRQRRR
jgi:Domain of unknown function (DUF5979)/Domain of unknown function DUF11